MSDDYLESRIPEPTASLLRRARAITPSGSQTLSKAYFAQPWGCPEVPLFIEKADGAWVEDVQGRRYLDYPMALGPIILGHNNPKVTEAIVAQLSKGILFSLPSPLEIAVAEKIVAAVPSAEMVKFLKTGSEACSAAVRLARAVTNRPLVAVGGFHGWHDFYAGLTRRSGGVPEAVRDLTLRFDFNDASSLETLLERHRERVAAILLEPATAEAPANGFLQEVRRLADEHGALLVFDEVVTGLRWSKGGAQEYYGVTPDLTVLGKALGNGMPIAAVTGPADLMRKFDELFVSGTYGGECLSLAAAQAVLRVLEDEPVVEYIWSQGRRLRESFSEAVHRHGLQELVDVTGEPPRVVLSFKEDAVAKSIVGQELAKREVLFNGSFFVSYAHTDNDIELTIAAVDEALGVLAEAVASGDPGSYLEGAVGQPVL